jgi:hypothetical protein
MLLANLSSGWAHAPGGRHSRLSAHCPSCTVVTIVTMTVASATVPIAVGGSAEVRRAEFPPRIAGHMASSC